MLHPSINLLREKVDSRYTLVVMASKRAREVIKGKPSLLDEARNIEKPVSIAINEIAEDIISYTRNEEIE